VSAKACWMLQRVAEEWWTMNAQSVELRERPPEVAAARAFLQKHHCLALATDGPAGLWASTVFYVNDGFDLYFLSGAATRHVRNIDANPHVAATVNDDVEDWLSIRAVQLEGAAERVDDSHRREVLEQFDLRYAFPDQFWWSEEGTVPREEQRIYRIRPHLFLFYDHHLSTVRLAIPSEVLCA
jgi:uncharacterized protein YhbP (UPF0306 family)